MKRLALFGFLALLAGCDSSGDDNDKALPTAIGKIPASAGSAIESEYGTPVKDRVAKLGLLNKRNNLTQDIVLKTGEARRIGNVIVRLATCEKTLPWENPPETGAFAQVFVHERVRANAQPEWRQVFSGWLFRNSPSINVVEHPVYDVWVKDCAMKFPGEDEPAPVATPGSAANPSGNVSASPLPSPSPSSPLSPAPASARPE